MNTKQTEVRSTIEALRTERALKLALEAFEADASNENFLVLKHCVREALMSVPDGADSALDRMAENARELGLDYEPPCKTGSQCTNKCPKREQPAQRQEPVISTAHGPWIPSTHPGEEGESYCKRCLLRDKFLGSRQCDPHIVPPEQPAQQEPVARSKAYDMIDRFLQNNLNSDEDYAEYSKALDSIYTSPQPSKPWVGLTDWEREKLRSEADEADAGYTQLIKATEAKLRELNEHREKNA